MTFYISIYPENDPSNDAMTTDKVVKTKNEKLILYYFLRALEFCQTPTQLGTQLNLNWSELELTLFSNVTRTLT